MDEALRTLAETVLAACRSKQLLVATAESCTGGMVAAALTDIALTPTSNVPMIGASGAIAGVMGAYYVLFPRARILTFIPIFIIPWVVEVPAMLFLGWWFLLQLFSGTVAQVLPSSGGGVAWWGHIGGFIAGVLLVTLFNKPSRR